MQGIEDTELQTRINWEWNGLLEILYPNSSSFVQQSQPKLCRDLSGNLSCYAWFYSHRNTHCSRIDFSGPRDRLFLLSLSTVIGASLVCSLLFLLSCFHAFLLSGFPAFLLSCLPVFLLSCFPSVLFSFLSAFLLSCFSYIRCWYTIVQSTVPAPGRDDLPSLPNVRCWYTIVQSTMPAPGRDGLHNLPTAFCFPWFLIFPAFLLVCFPACLLSCFSTFLLVCFAVLLLRFVSAFVFACLCFAVLVLLSFLCRVVLHIMLTLSCSVRVQFSPYQPAVVQRRSGSSMASLDKASAAWL